MKFSLKDLEDLEARGISVAEAERQLGFFSVPPAPARLERAATVGDGILRLSEAEQTKYERHGRDLLVQGGVTKFVPASGAASRMFKELLAALEGEGGMPAGAAAEALNNADKFAFYETWKKAAGTDSDKAFAMRLATGHWRDSLRALLQKPGLGYASAPKALLGFHRVGNAVRTAMEEQLREGLELGAGHLHFTVSTEHRHDFSVLAKQLALHLPYSFSEQSPSTDTLAGTPEGGAFRDEQDRLLFRPGGHGALLHNLQSLADQKHAFLSIKNIDNIAHPRLWPENLRWKRILLGLLSELGPQDRPVRVAGVVPNAGDAGGGPFWVGGGLQIVESAQVDMNDAAQKSLFDAGTHFNPVDIACRLVDKQHKAFRLEDFRDPAAVFVAQKSQGGKPLQALEQPGLWNGSMAHWKTVFVEVPGATFTPVKTVTDLLKPAHQP